MMLDDEVLSAPVIDHRGLDLDAAARVTYILEQVFRYEYETPVASLRLDVEAWTVWPLVPTGLRLVRYGLPQEFCPRLGLKRFGHGCNSPSLG